jgi:ammonia channel protein AmtB
LAFALYQMIFANTASTFVGGGMAERMNLPCYFTYGILQTGNTI